MPTAAAVTGNPLVAGRAAGPVMFTDVAVSFMGGVDPADGTVTDTHHPLRGRSVADRILVIPSGRGSCAGSLGIAELLLNGHAPRALVFRHPETILTLGVIIAQELFGRGIPVLRVDGSDFEQLADVPYAAIDGATITPSRVPVDETESIALLDELSLDGFELTRRDRMTLGGASGRAAAIALRIVIRTARLQGVNRLVDVDMAHIDGNFYHGPGTLQFARRLRELGARVRVPSTMNSIRVDRRRWRLQGVDERLGSASEELADAYAEMGVRETYTCAPYALGDPPCAGQQIAWGESNAVVYANSVLGARTLKYPDYLDVMVAITGRAPEADCHRADGRRATLRVDVPRPAEPDDAYFALLGYHVGTIATNEIPSSAGWPGYRLAPTSSRASVRRSPPPRPRRCSTSSGSRRRLARSPGPAARQVPTARSRSRSTISPRPGGR